MTLFKMISATRTRLVGSRMELDDLVSLVGSQCPDGDDLFFGGQHMADDKI